MYALLVVLSGFLFALMGALIKEASTQVPSAVTVFFRNFFGLLILLPWIRLRKVSIRTRSFHLHALRALAGLTAMYCFFYAIAHLDLAEAVLLNYTLPLFMPFIAFFWLGEEVPPSLKAAVIIGFVGVAFILKPGGGVFEPAALIGLSAGVLGALAQVTIRRLTATEPVTRIVFYFASIATVVSFLPLLRLSFTLNARILITLFLAGLCGTVAQLLLTGGYAGAPASRVGPFIYSSVVFAALFDWWIWDQVPDLLSITGALLVCGGGILARAKRTSESSLVKDS